MATSASNKKTRSESPDKEEEDLTAITAEQLQEVPRAPFTPAPPWNLAQSFMAERLPDGVRNRQWRIPVNNQHVKDAAKNRYGRAIEVFLQAWRRKRDSADEQRANERLRIYDSRGNRLWRLDHQVLLNAGSNWENMLHRARRHQQEVDGFPILVLEELGPDYISFFRGETEVEAQSRLASAAVKLFGLQGRLVDEMPLKESASRFNHLALDVLEKCRDAHEVIGNSITFKIVAFFSRLVMSLGYHEARSTGQTVLYCCGANAGADSDTFNPFEACYNPALEYSGYIVSASRIRFFFYSESGFVAARTKIPTTRDPDDPHPLSYLQVFSAYGVNRGVCSCRREDIALSISTYMGFMWAMPETVAWWDLLYPVINKILRGHGFAKAFTCLVVGYTSKHELAALVSACLKIATVKTRPLLEPYAALVTQISSASYVSEKARDNTFLAGKNKAPEKSNEDADAENPSKRRRLEIVVE